MQICGDFEGFRFNSALFGRLVSWHLIFDYPNVPQKKSFYPSQTACKRAAVIGIILSELLWSVIGGSIHLHMYIEKTTVVA